MNWSQISEGIPLLLVIMSYREWDSGEGGREKKGRGSQTSVTAIPSSASKMASRSKELQSEWKDD